MIISPYMLSEERYIKEWREAISYDAESKGWVTLFEKRGSEAHSVEGSLKTFLQVNVGTDASGYEHSKCGDMMIVVDEGLDCYGKYYIHILAKNVISGKPIDTIDCMFIYSVMDHTPVFLETKRSDILGKDMRVDGYVNKGVKDSASLRKIYMDHGGRGLNLGGLDSCLVKIPLTMGMKANVCSVTGLSIIGHFSVTAYTDYSEKRYCKKDLHYSTYALANRRDHAKRLCTGCNRQIIDDEIVEKHGIEPWRCRECLRENIYKGHIRVYDDEFPDMNQGVIPPTDHIEYIQYMIEKGQLSTNLNVMSPSIDADACLRVSVKSDDCEFTTCRGFSDIINIHISVKSKRRRKRKGRVVNYVFNDGKRIICLLYIKEGNQYTLYGRIKEDVIMKMISSIMVDGGDIFYARILFAPYNYSYYALRHPVSITAKVSDNYDSMNKIKRLYAASLLNG